MSKLFLNGKEAIQFGDGTTTIEQVAEAALLDFPTDYISGYKTKWINSNTIEISNGFARDANDLFNIKLETGPVQITLSGDLDTGSEAANTWYAIYVIGDSEGVNPTDFVFSANETTPTLPTGYDVYRRIGWARNNGSSNILSFEEIGNGVNRTVWWNQENTLTRVLTNGAAQSFTEVDASNYSPPSSSEFICLISFKTGSGGGSQSDNKLHIRGKLSTITDSLTIYSSGEKTTDFMNDHLLIRTDDDQLFEYRVDATSNRATLAVAAYLDVL